MPSGARGRNFKLIDDWGHHVRYVNGSTALEEGDMVVITSNVLVEVADSNTTTVLGVCGEDIAASAEGTVITAGVFEASAASGVDFGIGDEVYIASASTLDAGSQNDMPVGIVTAPDPASAGTVRFILWSIAHGEWAVHA